MKKPKQPKPIIELTYEDAESCDGCGKDGAMDFAGELLCKDCVCSDVFNDYNEVN